MKTDYNNIDYYYPLNINLQETMVMEMFIIYSGLDGDYSIVEQIQELFPKDVSCQILTQPELILHSIPEEPSGVILIEGVDQITPKSIRTIRERVPTSPLILVSNRTDVESVVTGMQAGLDNYIPITEKGRLIKLLTDCIKNRQNYRSDTSCHRNVDICRDNLLRKFLCSGEYQKFVQNLSIVFFVYTPDLTNVLYISPSYEKVWGRSRQSYLEDPLSFLDSVHEDDRDKLWVSIERQSNGEPVDQVYRIKQPGGQIRWLHGWSMPILDRQGKPCLSLGIAEDISEFLQIDDSLSTRGQALTDQSAKRTARHVEILAQLLNEIAEHQQTELELRASKERYQALIELLPSAVFVLIDGKIVFTNPAGLHLLRAKEHSELISRYFTEFVHPSFVESFSSHLELRGELKKPSFIEVQVTRLDGRISDAEVYTSSFTYENQAAALVILRDVSERKHAEQLRQESDARFRHLFETMAQGVVYQDRSGKIISANPAAERILGLSLDQMQGRTSTDSRWHAIHEDGTEFPGDQHPAMVALATGREVHGRIMGVYNPVDEDYRWVLINAVPQFKVGEGTPHQVYTTFEDITALRKVETTLRSTNQLLGAIIQASPLAIEVIDRSGRTVFWSPAAEQLLGWKADEVIGKMLAYIPEPQVERVKQSIHEDFHGKIRYEVETKHQHRDGSLIDISLSTAPVINSRGEIVGIMAIRTNITKRKRVEAELRRRLELERTVSKISAEFLSRSTDETDHVIGQALKTIGSLVGADRCHIYLIDENERVSRKTKGWCSPIVEPFRDIPPTIPFQEFRWFTEQLSQSGSIVISSTRDVPDNAHPEMFLLEQVGAKSALAVPLMYDQSLIGILGFDTIKDEKEWKPEDIALLQTVGNLIVSAMQRKDAEELVHESKRQAEALAKQLVEVQETERRWLAHELHDEIGQIVTGLNFTLTTLDRNLPESARPILANAQAITTELITVVREMSMNLRPPVLDDGGLLEALYWHFERFTSSTGIQVHFQETGIGQHRFASCIETAAYRIVQEALTNVARHAAVKEVFVQIDRDEKWLVIQIEDHGKGINVRTANHNRQSSGLDGMRERAVLLGGKFKIDTRREAGTTLRIQLPVEWQKEQEDDYNHFG